MATLTADGVQKAFFNFGETLTDGQVGVGTFSALSRFDDLTVFAAPTSANAVPEPTTISLAVVLLMGIAIRQRRRE